MKVIKEKSTKKRGNPNFSSGEAGQRGRKKGSSSLIIISDGSIEPYYISKDKYCYTIFEKDVDGNKKGTKPLGHYNDFSYVLKALAKLKMEEPKEYSSIKEYLDTYENLKLEINKILNVGI